MKRYMSIVNLILAILTLAASGFLFQKKEIGVAVFNFGMFIINILYFFHLENKEF